MEQTTTRDQGSWPAVRVDARTAAAEQQLADELRRILNRLVLVRPTADELTEAAGVARQFAARLDALPDRGPGAHNGQAGLQPQDHVRHSPLSGTGNAIAPPMQMSTVGRDEDGHPVTEGTVRFGAAYEGPPGHVHGGFVAAMFDELLGRTQGSAGFTGRLTVTYRRPSPLHHTFDLRASMARIEGRKRWIRGTCHLDGVLLTEAEGLFIAPRGGASLAAVQESLLRDRT